VNKSILNFLNEPLSYSLESIQTNLDRLPLKFTPWLKKKSNNKFSVVSAVYGVEKYLDDFFASIINQTLTFEEHIQLIMVDDGSLDGSAKIVEKWVKKYPDNIQYIKKENGGQASARNLGMTYVSNEWVTFIDPDDFINKRYFETVDNLLASSNNPAMISCNFIFYYEASNRFRDTHPLKYRFENENTTFTIPELSQHIQLSVNSAFFRSKIINDNKLVMDSRIKPNFEDAHFVGSYLLLCNGRQVIFTKKAKYFYRKRQDDSSTLDGSWKKKDQYSNKLLYGDLALLKQAEKKGKVIPDYIQRIVLYDLIWYFRNLVNHKEKLSFLSKTEKGSFVSLLRDIFKRIDKKIIAEFELVSCDAYFKTGWLHLFKDSAPSQYDFRIDGFDDAKNQLKLSYYYNTTSPLELITQDNNNAVKVVYSKIREHDFMGESFVLEKIIWVQLDNNSSFVSASIKGSNSTIIMGNQKYKDKINITDIKRFFKSSIKPEKEYSFGLRFLRVLARMSALLPFYQNAWVFMDRDVQADDNAEHLYRHIKKKKTEVNARFILRKTSHDWARLKEEGFRLIPFGSIRHMILMFNAKHLISSHADNYVVNYPPVSWFSGIINYKYTFLQHGVTKDDISNWLNNKAIDVFVTASEREYRSIAGEQNKYKYTDKEVCLTGFARHDELLRKSKILLGDKTHKKTLLIMPTWRENLVGKTHWMSNNRRINDDFYTSEYATSWKSLLHSTVLQKLVKDHNLDVVFFPHANISPYIDWFDLPSHITQVTHQSGQSIQDLFVSASLMLTDYSSVAFEVSYLEKPVIYYQFDSEQVFGGEHLTAKGYYDYTDDGFGPVCENEQDLLLSLEKVIENNCDLESKYLDRVNKTFKYRDGKCCERIYESIVDLDY